jgi:putative transposase
MIPTPTISTVHTILDRHGLVKRPRRNRHYKAESSELFDAKRPNQLWCADYK